MITKYLGRYPHKYLQFSSGSYTHRSRAMDCGICLFLVRRLGWCLTSGSCPRVGRSVDEAGK